MGDFKFMWIIININSSLLFPELFKIRVPDLYKIQVFDLLRLYNYVSINLWSAKGVLHSICKMPWTNIYLEPCTESDDGDRVRISCVQK